MPATFTCSHATFTCSQNGYGIVFHMNGTPRFLETLYPLFEDVLHPRGTLGQLRNGAPIFSHFDEPSVLEMAFLNHLEPACCYS